MAKKLGEFKVKKKEIVSIEAYNIPNPAYTDNEGRQYVLESNFRHPSFVKSDLHLSGRVPISLVSIEDEKRIDLTISVPDERVLGLEDVLKNQKDIVVRLRGSDSSTKLVSYGKSQMDVVRFTEIPEHATLRHYVDPEGKFIGSLATGFGIRGASMSVSDLKTEQLISRGSFEFDSGLWNISDILFGKNYACMIHSHKTDDWGWCSDEIRDYIHVVNLKTGKFETKMIQDEGAFHFAGSPTIFGNCVAVPLESTSSAVSAGNGSTREISIVDLEKLTVKTSTKLNNIFGDKKYSPLFGVPDLDKVRFFFAEGRDYAVATIDSEGNVNCESCFKGPSLRRYNFLGQSFSLNKITNLDMNDGVITALVRPEGYVGIPIETHEEGIGLYALAIGYDVKTREASFFPLHAPGAEIPVSELNKVYEFFQGKVGKNMPLLQTLENRLLE